MSDVHTLCCECEFQQLEISEAFECQQRQGLQQVWQAELRAKLQGQKQYAQPQS